MSDDDKNAEIEFYFQRASYYHIYPANGAWGGITPQGEFMIDFFVERNRPPEKVVHSIATGKLGPELRREPSPEIVRELQVGILMSREEAKGLAKFIVDKIADYDRIKSKVEEETPNA
jgi:hypothetical protein